MYILCIVYYILYIYIKFTYSSDPEKVNETINKLKLSKAHYSFRFLRFYLLQTNMPEFHYYVPQLLLKKEHIF